MTGRSAAEPGDGAATVSVTATGSARVVPDQVRIDLAVQAVGPDVGGALRQASQGVERLRGVLDAAGVADLDRSTTGLTVQPSWDARTNEPDGHVASYALRVVVRDLDAAGQLVEDAAAQVGDLLRVHGFGLSVGDPSPAERDARAAAVRACRVHAEQVATAAGAVLAELVQLTEVGGPAGRRSVRLSASAMAVEGGEQEVAVTVTGVWRLRVGASGPA